MHLAPLPFAASSVPCTPTNGVAAVVSCSMAASSVLVVLLCGASHCMGTALGNSLMPFPSQFHSSVNICA